MPKATGVERADGAGQPSPRPPGRPDSRRIAGALAYVHVVARRYRTSGLPFEELLAAGNLGLVEAALRYEPSRSVKFVTYADWWIRKAILQTIEEQTGAVRLPRYRQQQLRTMRDGRRRFRRTEGQEPDADELARETGLKARDIRRLQLLGRGAVSLEEPTTRDGEQRLLDRLASEDEPDPQDRLIRGDLARRIRSLMAALERRQRLVLMMRFGFGDLEPMTLREIGRRLGISRERVRQIERRAVIELRNSISSEFDATGAGTA